MNMSALDDIAEVISRARVVAMEYYRLTGKPLGITLNSPANGGRDLKRATDFRINPRLGPLTGCYDERPGISHGFRQGVCLPCTRQR